MQNRQQILDFARQMLREKRYDEARKLLRALPKEDVTAQQWLTQIDERERAESAADEALAAGSRGPSRRPGRPLGELLRASFRLPTIPAQKKPPSPKQERPETAEQAQETARETTHESTPRPHPLAAPPEPEASAPPATPEPPAASEALYLPEDPEAEREKIHPDELPVAAILTRSLVLAGVVIGIIMLILLFLGG